ncbi:hypothetical protein HNP46_004224 [Pseudomonas nitritireducens]|uniref:Uncharacterized protein n=1 Tax=Pseudomonas nitroreducens TaxID=46680 RepID=A0A7W7P1Y7_PSENT|nr:hypothetical protein [Pseudomonas nitritireducens]
MSREPMIEAVNDSVKTMKVVSTVWRDLQVKMEKAKKDPHNPVPRSKGEKARNRSRRRGTGW